MKKIRLTNEFTEEAYLLTNVSEANLEKFLKRNYPTYPGWVEGAAAGRMEDPQDENECRSFFIWVSPKQNKAERRLVVIHEVIHLVMSIFADRGIPISHANDETFAYVHGHFCQQVFTALKL